MRHSLKHIAIVCNPTRENAKALRVVDELVLVLEEAGITYQCFLEGWPPSFDSFSEVWISGGDGTINWFINQYPEIKLPLAVFTGGSGNDFQWMLYGDKTVKQQAEQALRAIPRMVDAGSCNGKLFLNGAGIGFDGAVVHNLSGKKKLAGKASYLLSIMKHVISYREKPCLLEMNGQTRMQDFFMISVANGKRYGGGFQVAPRADLRDGLLDLVVIGAISPLNRMRYLPVIEKGAHLSLDFISYEQLRHVVIRSPVKIHAHLDGEYLSDTHFDIRVLPERFSFLY